MNSRLVGLLLCGSLFAAVQARAKTVLPDACGDDSVKFDVLTKTNQPAPAPPASGKAQIIFIENDNKDIGCVALCEVTTRVGMDGAWVGANNGNSYFALTVDSGVHHLCASWQSALSRLKKNVDVVSFTAEPGKVYYFAAQIVGTGSEEDPATIALSQLNEDEGQYRVEAWKLATWKTK
ncbi:MAG: hypothetical protein ABR976_11415 [Terracidiphilus sp.]|jgi:hypothetical protein